MSKIVTGALAALLFGFCGSTSSAATYYMNLMLGTASAVGTITTDGTIGTLSNGNIVDYDLTLANGAFSAVLDISDGTISNGNSLTATTTGLFFDFSSNTGSYFMFGGNPGLGFEDASGSLSGHPSTISLNLDGVGDPSSPIWTGHIGNVEIAAATPLPAALPLFITGLGALALLRRSRRRIVMKSKLFAGALAGVLGMGLVAFNSSDAEAVVVQIEYTGTVLWAHTPYTDFVDQSYVADFVFDLGVSNPGGSYSSPNYNYVFGGTSYGSSDSPAVSVTLKIGATVLTLSSPATQQGYISGTNNYDLSGGWQQYHFAQDAAGSYLSSYIVNHLPSTFPPATIDQPFMYIVQPNDNRDSVYCDASGRCMGLYSLTLTETVLDGATPLPAALPLFATGLGALGLLGWRRNRKIAKQAS